MNLVTADQMRQMDRRAIDEIGIPGIVLMENAGRAAADLFQVRFAEQSPGPVLVLAGKGNNGGDGYVIARCLLQRGWQVQTVVLAEQSAVNGDAGRQLQILLRCGGQVRFAPDSVQLTAALQSKGRLIVDALLGTGLTSEVGGLYAQAVDWINNSGLPVLAVDMPSGIDASNGALHGRAVRAHLTITFAVAKVGQAVYPGAAHVGDLAVVDIGIPDFLRRECGGEYVLFDLEEAKKLLAPRPLTGHKGTFGHLLLVAGSVGKTGAASMAAEGGVRAGAGLVSVACPRSVQEVLAGKLTEAMTLPLPDLDGALALSSIVELQSMWAGKKAVALGPGLGQTEEVFALARRLISECPSPMVIDADALNALAGHTGLLAGRAAPAILTPHPGEMARLADTSVADVESDRIGVARAFACRHRVVLVLKGARTVTASPDGQLWINASGHPGMASGGMGDVLTGLIGGLLAQGMPAESAAALGVFLHGKAADRLRPVLGDAGMIATDLLREIPAARREITKA